MKAGRVKRNGHAANERHAQAEAGAACAGLGLAQGVPAGAGSIGARILADYPAIGRARRPSERGQGPRERWGVAGIQYAIVRRL